MDFGLPKNQITTAAVEVLLTTSIRIERQRHSRNSMVVSNPYLTKRTTTTTTTPATATVNAGAQNRYRGGDGNGGNFRTTQKRLHRPWDGEPVGIATAMISTGRTANSQQEIQVVSTSRSTNNNNSLAAKSESVVDLFEGDDGFDWTAAVELMDAAVPTNTNVSAANTAGAVATKTTTSRPPLNPRRGVDECRQQCATMKENMNDNSAHPSHAAVSKHQTALTTITPLGTSKNHQESKAAALPNHNKAAIPGVPPDQKMLRALRPKSWLKATDPSLTKRANASVTSSPSTTITTTASVRSSHSDAVAKTVLNAHDDKSNRGDPQQHGLPKEIQFSPNAVQPVNDGHLNNLLAHAFLTSPLKNNWHLFPHQKTSLRQSLAMRRSILALDMGLGKTLIGCVWASAFLQTSLLQCKRVLILCPVTLQKEWVRTALEATGMEVVDPETKTSSKKKSRKTMKSPVASDEDSLDDGDNSVASTSSVVPPKATIHSWAKVPSVPEEGNFIVVADEAHSIQSMEAARTRSTLELALHKRCIGVLLLTGTPMKNGKPANLYPLLKAVRHPFGRNRHAYEKHFCEGKHVFIGRARSVWQATGASNLDQLRVLTKSHMQHLSKEDCLKELPPKTRQLEKVPVCSRQQNQQNQAMQFLQKVYKASKDKTARDRNGDSGDAVLGALQKARLIGSLAKVEATVQYAKMILHDEPAIVIFTCFQEPARQVHRKLTEAGWTGELLTGETPAKNRQIMVDNFQNGLSPVFVCTFGAGGVGITLTAARTIILLDRPWTPGDVHQAEDRVRRIGQTYPVKCIWMQTSFRLDEQIDDMIEHKNQTSTAVLTESSTTKEEKKQQQQQRLSIFKLLDQILEEQEQQQAKQFANLSGTTSINLKQTSMLQFSQPCDETEGRGSQ